ncbi:MAG TPA: VanZ family protein [Gemmataceae bacterium]|nr:VanZ family protein [Gemmataceae bacterium]
MADTWDQTRVQKLLVRGLGWCLCVALWTTALLTTYPVKVGESVTPHGWYFPAAKCLHISAYAFLTAYLTWLPLGRWRWLLLAFLSMHAAGTEFFQLYVPGRYGQVTDVLIDHCGLALGVALTWKRWLPRLRRPGSVSDGEHAVAYASGSLKTTSRG